MEVLTQNGADNSITTKNIEKSIDRMWKRASGEKNENVSRDVTYADVEVTISRRTTSSNRGQIIVGHNSNDEQMSVIIEPAKEIPILTSCDVLVIGGGSLKNSFFLFS